MTLALIGCFGIESVIGSFTSAAAARTGGWTGYLQLENPSIGQTVIVRKDGPNLLVRFVWWLLVGWWASGIVVGLAWLALITVVGFPVAIWLINRLPSVLTLRPRTRIWTIGQDAEGRTVISEGGRPQTA